MITFNNPIDKYKSSTLSVIYSMLKTTIVQQHNIDINYPKLNDFLKQCYLGYVPKKSNVFISEDIRRFLHEAPDTDFLALKVRHIGLCVLLQMFYFVFYFYFRLFSFLGFMVLLNLKN